MHMDKLKQLFARVKKVCKHLKDFFGKPISKGIDIDEVFKRPDSKPEWIPFDQKISARQ